MATTYFTKEFDSGTVQGIVTAINAFLAANPTWTPINVTLTQTSAQFWAILTYSKP